MSDKNWGLGQLRMCDQCQHNYPVAFVRSTILVHERPPIDGPVIARLCQTCVDEGVDQGELTHRPDLNPWTYVRTNPEDV
jgi:hypothetical protein